MPLPAILVLLAVVAGVASTAGAAPRPNIVVILVDDMGFSDIGCYGGEIRTPHLDALAAGGLRFTQFYNTARCCPTRAALLTGLYPHQAGVGHMVGHVSDDKGLDGYRGELSRHAPTIAEVLRAAGYSTAMVGKWHVTSRLPPAGPKDNWPVARGFDRYLGIVRGAAGYFDIAGLVRDDTPIGRQDDDEARSAENSYASDVFADGAVTFIDEHCRAASKQPLFLYAAFTAPHWPLHAPADVVARYRGSYAAGWEKIRAARHARQVEMGLVDAAWPLSPSPRDGAAWDRLDPAQRDELDLRMATYAAQVDRMDEGVGRIVTALRRNGLLDDTLILFLSDNGGCAEGGMLGGGPAKQLGTQAGYMLSYGEAWANVSNTPFREYKHFVHEGGIATPLVAHWPAGIARRGEFERQPGHLVDIMATCLDVAGAAHPPAWQGAPTTPPEGRSLVPAFAGRQIDREALFWEHEGNRAVRIGDWKLVAKGPRGRWELYDLAKDRTELNDLAEHEPERVRDMAATWEAWAVRAKAKPWPWDRRR